MLHIRRRAIGDERGIAIPVALAILFLVWGLATVSLRAALASQNQSQRDRDVKRALQAASAGVDAAMYRLNLLQPESFQCIIVSAGTLAVSGYQADGWCPEQTEELSDNATYRMRASRGLSLHVNGQSLVERQIVSTGFSNGVRRRVLTRITAATGEPVFPGGYAGVSLTALDIGNNVQVAGGLGTNGNILLKNSAQVCGDTTPGPGKSLSIQNNASVCSGYSVTPTGTPFNLQPVDQGNAPTVNDNVRIGNPPSGLSPDQCTSCSGVNWNPSTRVLELRQNSTLTLGGNVYSFCRLELDNTAQLKIAARELGTAVRIYMDSPENCGGGNGMGSVSVRNDSQIVNMNTIPDDVPALRGGKPDDRDERRPRKRGHPPDGPRDGDLRSLLDRHDAKQHAPDWSDRGTLAGAPEQCDAHLQRPDRGHHDRQPLAPLPVGRVQGVCERPGDGGDRFGLLARAGVAPSIGPTPDTGRAGRQSSPPRTSARPASSASKDSGDPRPSATSSIVPTSTRTMCRMKASASIQNSSTCPALAQRASRTFRSKRTWSVRVGVKAVKSCVPRSNAAHAASAASSSGCGHHSERPCSNGQGAARASSR